MENEKFKIELGKAKTYMDMNNLLLKQSDTELTELIMAYETFKQYSALTMFDETVLSHAKFIVDHTQYREIMKKKGGD